MSVERKCPICDGSGAVYVVDGDAYESERCDFCAGDGSVLPSSDYQGAVDRAEKAEAWVMRLYGMLSAGKKSMVLSDVQPVLVRAREGSKPS